MKLLKQTFILTAVLLLRAFPVSAEDRWTHFLPLENVTRMRYDPMTRTYWFGTDGNGVWRFDGRQFEHLLLPETPRYGSVQSITALAVDGKNQVLWIGTAYGLFQYHTLTRAWNYYDECAGLSINYIKTLLVDPYGVLWYGSEGGGVGKKDSTGWFKYNTQGAFRWDLSARCSPCRTGCWVRFSGKGPASNNVDCVAQDQQNNLYFGARGSGLSIFSPADSLWNSLGPFNAVLSIAIDRSGNKWLGTTDGVYWLDQQNRVIKFFVATTDSGLAGNWISSVWIEPYRDGEFKWFATSGGVSRLDSTNRPWKSFTNANSGLGSSEVQEIIGDDDGNLWFALSQAKGVSKLNNNWSTLKTEDGLRSNFVYAVVKDDRGRLWAGTDSGDVEILAGGTWKKRVLVNPHDFRFCDQQPVVRRFLPDRQRMWIATYGCGIFALSDDLSISHHIRANAPVGFPSNRVLSLAVRGDTLWAGTEAGLARLVIADARATLSGKFLSGIKVTALAFDATNKLWVGTASGLWRYNGTAFDKINIPVLAANVGIEAVARDSDDRMWIGTTAGIARFDGAKWESWTSFSTANRLPNNHITAIGIATDKAVWCGTTNGAAIFANNDWTPYSTADGLSDNLILDLGFGPDDVVWFATFGGGISRYRRTGVLPETYFLDMFDIVSVPKVVFRYAGYDFNTPTEQLSYQYALDDTSQWSPVTPANFVELVIAAEGRHTFYVRAIDRDGNLDPTPATLHFYKLQSQQGGVATIVDTTPGQHGSRIQLYIPPDALPEGISIRAMPLPADSLQLNDEEKKRFTGVAYKLSASAEMNSAKRPITVRIFYGAGVAQNFAESKLALFRRESQNWLPLGGTVDTKEHVLTTTSSRPGTFALFVHLESVTPAQATSALALAVQPRMLSPQGRGFLEKATISFTLAQTTAVTMKVYNLAGRLVKILCENQMMNAGRNAVDWEGDDYNRKICPSGMYVICLEAAGNTTTKTVVVLNN
ncbi:MAG: hypothetical protein ALAOOOJD_00083 [bacterium]|nr:hypothetical protein [bacterium]